MLIKNVATPRWAQVIGAGQALWGADLHSTIMAKLIKIAEVKDVLPGQAAAFTVEGQRVALFNVEGTYYAIADTCTQASGPLSEGEVQGTKVSCPWHGADFDLKTGAVLGPPAYEAVSSYKVVIEGDDIKVEV